MSKYKNESKKGLVIEKIEKDFFVYDIVKCLVFLLIVVFILESSNFLFDEGCVVEGNNN